MKKTLHFRIELMESSIPIWRRFQVRDDYRMDRFHQVLQIVMGWTNSHLHEFSIQERTIGMTGDFSDEFPELEEVSGIFLNEFKFQPGDQFIYLYDFGDDWNHRIEVEDVTDHNLIFPICVEGENHCPPEDCGGIPGYANLLSILADPNHEEYNDWNNWLPDGFEAYNFPRDQINGELLLFGQWHNKNPLKRSTPWHQID